MFETDVVEWDAARTLAAVDRACTAENEAGIERLILAAHFADLHPSPCKIPGNQTIPGGDRALIYGGPGCPGVSEFAIAEYALVRGVSPETAAKDIGQALALRHRHPLTWAAVMNRTATPWKARQVATECAALSVEAAAIVDRKVADIIDTLTFPQLRKIMTAAIWEADPEAAQAEAEKKARERGVWIGQSDEHGTTTMFIKAATGSVIRLNATITQLADALTTLGDTDPLQQRRAKAVDILSNPALADKLLKVAQYLATHSEAAQPGPANTATTETTCPAPSASTRTTDPTTQSGTRASNRHEASADTDATGTTPPEPTSTATTDITTHPDTAHPASTTATRATDTTAPTVSPANARTNDTGTDTNGSTTTPTTAQADPPANVTDAARPTSTTPAANRANTNTLATEPTDPALSAADGTDPEVTSDGQLASDLFLTDEPSTHTEADRDTPHPSHPGHPFDPPPSSDESPDAIKDLVANLDAALSTGIGAAARHDLATKLAAIKQATDADNRGTSRPGRIKLYIHLTDETLLAGGGITRVENYGPVFAPKLAELLGHDQIVVQPVIDLNQHINVNAYEIPLRIRERIKLMYPVEQFPYGTGETTNSTDLDHIKPYEPVGPPGQTGTTTLQPLRRPSHRVKTHAPGWTVRRVDDHTVEWTTLHGYKFRVDETGTHRIPSPHPTTDDTGPDQGTSEPTRPPGPSTSTPP